METLCLDQLLNNKKTPPFILLNDTIRFSCLSFLYHLCHVALTDKKRVIVITTETSPTVWTKHFSQEGLFIIDCYTDPYDWDNSIATDKRIHLLTDMKTADQRILSTLTTLLTPSCTIIMDSIQPLAMISQHKAYQLVKKIQGLTSDTVQFVMGYHSDIHLTSAIDLQKSFNRLASVIIQLEALKEKSHFDTQALLTGFIPQETFAHMTTTSNLIKKGGIAHIEWRKKSGKVQYESNGFIHKSGPLLAVVHVVELGIEKKQEEVVEEKVTAVDPTANLSFNLSLTDEQRKAKENLVLPYMKAQQLEVTSEQEEKKGGLIYYDPDAADDFDDEDPDEDLDI
ncbi:Elongator complex protein 5 [Pilobolus umbonatus]|nr:Elongator complex protein 5 [Pilobolus umbonatus]